jgi:hypothetical protein
MKLAEKAFIGFSNRVSMNNQRQLTPDEEYARKLNDFLERAKELGLDSNEAVDKVARTVGFTPQQIETLKIFLTYDRALLNKDMSRHMRRLEEITERALKRAQDTFNRAVEVKSGSYKGVAEVAKSTSLEVSKAVSKRVAEEKAAEAAEEVNMGAVMRAVTRRSLAAVLGAVLLVAGAGYGAFYLNKKINSTETGKMKITYDEQLATLNKEKNEMKKEDERLREKSAKGEAGLNAISGVVNLIEEQVYGTKDKKTHGLISEVGGLKGSVAKLDGDVYGIKDKKGLTVRVGDVEARNEEDKTKITGLEGKLEGVEGKITAVEGGVAGQKLIAAGLETRLGLLEGNTKKYAVHMRALDELRKTYENDDDFVKALSYIKAKLAEIEPEIKRDSREIYGDKDVAGLIGNYKELKALYDKAEAERKQLKDAYDGLKARVGKLEGDKG